MQSKHLLTILLAAATLLYSVQPMGVIMDLLEEPLEAATQLEQQTP